MTATTITIADSVITPVSATLTGACGKPAELRVLLPDTAPARACTGAFVKLARGDVMYVGRVCTVSRNKGVIFLRALDCLQYLDSGAGVYVRDRKRLSDVFRDVVSGAELDGGDCDPCFRTLSFREYDSASYIKIITDAIYDERLNTRRDYAVYDDLGKLCLRDTANLRLPVTITQVKDDVIVATDTRGIKNSVTARKSLRKLGRREIYTAEDKKSIARHGKHAYVTDVGEFESVRAVADNLCALHGGAVTTVSFTCPGVPQVRENRTVALDIPGIRGDVSVTEVTHVFEESYTMRVAGRLK